MRNFSKEVQYKRNKIAANKLYESVFHKKIHWDNPATFMEKIHIFKISDEAETLWPYADKYEARKYIQRTVGKKYLNTVYGVYNSVDEIDFDTLPNEFVIKCTHGSGWNIICKNKAKLDWEKAKIKLNRWMKRNYYKSGKERQYKLMTPRIICEKLLKSPGYELRDYKFFCFDGVPHLLETVKDRHTNLKRFFFDSKWKRLPIKSTLKSEIPEENDSIEKPSNLQEMLEVASKLSKGFRHVRVDLYSIEDKIYVGELTFTTGNGTFVFDPPEYDKELSKYFNIDNLV